MSELPQTDGRHGAGTEQEKDRNEEAGSENARRICERGHCG